MSFAKLFKFAKKGSKKVKKTRNGAPSEASTWPSGTKIGVFGHENTGKTVYFTVLYHESKIAKNIQISVTDNLTSCEFLSNYMGIWGLGSGEAMGTVIDTVGEKKFPDPTVKDTILQFTAILDGTRKIPVVTYDYTGKAVSISEESDESEKVRDFMAEADGILFFFDPKILGADSEVQARTYAFINMLEQITPLKSRLPIPVGLVITKADTLPGYNGEDRTILINPENEHFVAENFEQFLEKVLNSSNVTADSTWTSSVRKILVKLREFLRVVVGRTLDFQIFFISNTGNEPLKIGTDIGRSIYQPPEVINPCGVKEPFYWILNAVVRNKRFNLMRRIVRHVAIVSIIWVVCYSLPFLYHFGVLLSRPYGIEDSVLESVEGNIVITSDTQRSEIIKSYNRYGNKWLVKKLFPAYKITASRMKDVYQDFSMGPILARLDSVIVSVTKIVEDPDLRPKYDPGQDSLFYDDDHKKLKAFLDEMHVGDKTSVLFLRSGRVIRYWDLFTQVIKKPGDTNLLDAIDEQVAFNENNAPNYNENEKLLGHALLNITDMEAPAYERPSAGTVRTVLNEYNQIKERVNGSDDPDYILGEASKRLETIMGRLRVGLHDEQISSIKSFLDNVKRFEKKQKYTCVMQTVPDFGHLHIEVTGSGGEPTWAKAEEQGQLLEGSRIAMEWKAGDDIHLAFDELGYCNWGKDASDKFVIRDKYALFMMQGVINFPNIGKTVTISFKPELKLPKLE